MNNTLAATPDPRPVLIALLVRSVPSPHSKAAYENALRTFFVWLGARALTRAAVLDWRDAMIAESLAPSTVSLRLTAVRQLAREARIAGLIDHDTANAIMTVRGIGAAAVRTGNWLTGPQAARLIQTPPAATLRGRRDRALLATLVGCGLRRQELAVLLDQDVQQREGRWCIVDLAGKGRKIRTIPMPAFCKALIDLWVEARDAVGSNIIQRANIIDGEVRLFRSMNNRGHLSDRMSPNAIYEAVAHWAGRANLPIAPHDLRRTFSRLALAGRADLHQIQLSLGHSSIQTTERYLGSHQDLANAPCDVLGIHLTEEHRVFLERLGAEDREKETAEIMIEERRHALPDP